jgi:hypothetical protein
LPSRYKALGSLPGTKKKTNTEQNKTKKHTKKITLKKVKTK